MKKRKQLFDAPSKKRTWEGLAARATDGDGIETSRTMSLSTPIVSAQDGPRMAGIKNFGGKKAAPFGSSAKKKIAKALAAKARASKKG